MELSDLKTGVDLFAYNTLRIRAKAQYFYEARSRADLVEVTSLAAAENLPLLVIGGGSNLAITKKEVKGIVVRNIYIKKEVVNDAPDHVDLRVSSGYPVSKLVRETTEEGLSGVEYHEGLPGTVGGAIYMNSKWTHPELYFGDTLIAANLVDKKGNEKTVERDYFEFAYDYSTLHKTKEIIIDAIFRFKKDDPKKLKKIAADSLAHRKKTQPHGVATSGCFFQNISEDEREQINVPTKSAGNLIDKSGLKGLELGAFIVSPHHGNFVINRGGGEPEDVKKLLTLIKTGVAKKFGIDLREEVVVI